MQVRGAAQGHPVHPGRTLSTVLSPRPARRAALHAGALGRGEPAAPAGGTCAAHVPSPGARGPPTSGCGSSGRVAGHLGSSALEEGEGALAAARPGASSCGPRPPGRGTLAGHLRPRLCACERGRRRQPPRPVPPPGPGARPRPPPEPLRPHAPGHAERQTAASRRSGAGPGSGTRRPLVERSAGGGAPALGGGGRRGLWVRRLRAGE